MNESSKEVDSGGMSIARRNKVVVKPMRGGSKKRREREREPQDSSGSSTSATASTPTPWNEIAHICMKLFSLGRG